MSRAGRLDLLVGDGLKMLSGYAGARLNLPVREHCEGVIDRLVKEHVPSEELSLERLAEEMGLIARRPKEMPASAPSIDAQPNRGRRGRRAPDGGRSRY